MHVKEKPRESFGSRFYTVMKQFDNPGDGRSAFKFMTYEGGYYHPHTFYLGDETIHVWESFWSQMQVQLRLFDPNNVEITRASQVAGISSAIFTQMVHPPTIYYQPRYRMLMSPEDDKFKGGRLNLEGQEGWYYEYEFTLTRDQLKSVNGAQARLAMLINGTIVPPQAIRTFAGAGAAGGSAPGGPPGGVPSGMGGAPGA